MNTDLNNYLSNYENKFNTQIKSNEQTLDLYVRRYNNLKDKSDNKFNNIGINTKFNNDIMQRLLNTNDRLIEELNNASTKKYKIEDKQHISKLLQLNITMNNYDKQRVNSLFKKLPKLSSDKDIQELFMNNPFKLKDNNLIYDIQK